MEEFTNHTFAICAYKESKYLEFCIKSLINQSVKSNIIMSTSTPNSYIENLAKKYNIQLYINKGKSGIGEDWNHAVSVCNTDYVTIAHQDDIYDKDYLKDIYEKIKDKNDVIIAFTDYGELRNDEKITKSRLLKNKRLMLAPLKFSQKLKRSKKNSNSIWKCYLLSKCYSKY